MKTCRKCNLFKPVSEFTRNSKYADGIESRCKKCAVADAKAWSDRNSEHVRAQRAAHYKENREFVRLKQKNARISKDQKEAAIGRREYYLKNRERILESNRKSREKHRSKRTGPWPKQKRPEGEDALRIFKAKRAAYQLKRLKIPRVKMHHCISKMILASLKKARVKKTFKSFDVLGYSCQDLMTHLEKQFLDGMTWDNHGAWHIDHIIPVSSFDIGIEDAVKKAWALTNLRPIWASDNLKKHAKILTLL